MNGLDVHRDEGPLAWLPGAGRGRVPEVLLLLVALLVLAAAAASSSAVGPQIETWTLIAIVWLVATLARWGLPLQRLDWPIPALLRAVEYGSALVLLEDAPWTFAYLATLAFHHYDIVYRMSLRGEGPPPWLRLAIGGWSVRLVVMVAASAAGHGRTTVVLLTVYLAPLIVSESVTGWLRQRATARP